MGQEVKTRRNRGETKEESGERRGGGGKGRLQLSKHSVVEESVSLSLRVAVMVNSVGLCVCCDVVLYRSFPCSFCLDTGRRLAVL